MSERVNCWELVAGVKGLYVMPQVVNNRSYLAHEGGK